MVDAQVSAYYTGRNDVNSTYGYIIRVVSLGLCLDRMAKALATTGQLGIHGSLPEGNYFTLHHS